MALLCFLAAHYRCTQTHKDKSRIHTHTKALIRTLGWHCAILKNYKWTHTEESHKTFCYQIHNIRGYIWRQRKCACMCVRQIYRESNYLCIRLRDRTQIESVIINLSLVSVCVCFLILKLPWLTFECMCCALSVLVSWLTLSCLQLCSCVCFHTCFCIHVLYSLGAFLFLVSKHLCVQMQYLCVGVNKHMYMYFMPMCRFECTFVCATCSRQQ